MSAYYHLGRVLLLQKRYDEAIAAFDQAARISPDSTSPEFGLAQVYLANGDYDEAMNHLTRKAGESLNTPSSNVSWLPFTRGVVRTTMRSRR